MTTIEFFRIVAPEFSGESDATVNQFIALAPSFINVNLYADDSLNLALALKTASLMLARKNSASGQSSGGELLSEKEGDLQRSYGAAIGKNDGLDIYMQQLRDLNMNLGINQYSASTTRMADLVPSL
jgi:hypothetical protein